MSSKCQMTREAIYCAVFGDPIVDTDAEQKANYKLIDLALRLPPNLANALKVYFEKSPIPEAEVTSPINLNALITLGMVVETACHGKMGYYSCTATGARCLIIRKAVFG